MGVSLVHHTCVGVIIFLKGISFKNRAGQQAPTIAPQQISFVEFIYLIFFFSQVSHHPPAAAHHAISDRGWTLRQEITVASKFRGKYLSIMPLGERRYVSQTCAWSFCDC